MAHLLRIKSRLSKFPFNSSVGRIAYSADGNQHDEDDWGATALAIAIASKGMQGNIVHWDFNNHIWDSAASFLIQSQESTIGGATKFNFNLNVFFDDTTQYSAMISNLSAEINKSSASDRLKLICAGPMETVYQAVLASDSSKRQYVDAISHSTWNETHGTGTNEPAHAGHSYTDLTALGITPVQIVDQNGTGRLGDQPLSNFSYFNNSSDPKYQWVYQRLDAVNATGTQTDASDAGMMWYAVSGGDQAVSPAKIQTHLGL